ncbi:MAG: molybdopterin-dependent oxidoreductase [Actinomycetes bacterium]
MPDQPDRPDPVHFPDAPDAPDTPETPDAVAAVAPPSRPQPAPRRRRAAGAGALAVAASLALGELVAAVVGGVPSLVLAVSSLVVPVVPPAVESWAIQTFGTDDKAVLAAGTVVLALLIGAATGLRAARRFGAAIAVFTSFGVVGWLAASTQPAAALGAVLVDAVLVVLVGLAVLHRLLEAARPPAPAVAPDGSRSTDTHAGRRTFIASAGTVGAAVLAAAGGARVLGRGRGAASGPPVDVALPDPPTPAPTVGPAQAFADVEGLTPVVVPNDEFYRIDTALSVPRIDAATWRLRVHGMVERELELSLADLAELDVVEHHVTIACVSNEVGDDLVGNALWRGVRLADVLAMAGVERGATQLVGRSVDGWTAGFPTDVALDGREALVAFGMNGEPLPFEHGFPARLIVPGLYGYVSATKWLSEIELTTWEGFDGYWVPRGWAKEGPIKTQSRIDVPRADTRVVPGRQPVAGVAWAPTRGISRVEVQLDDRPWREAELTAPLSDDAWVQWRLDVDVPDGVHVLRVRATDGTGETQTEEVAEPRPDGATGWHTIRVFT